MVGEVLPGLSKRRDFSTVEKLRILAQRTATGSSPALTCRTHGISSGQFYTWRKRFRSGALTGFVPASMASDVAALPSLAPIETPPATPLAGHVEVELPNGVKVRVRGALMRARCGKFFQPCDDPRIKSGDPSRKFSRLSGVRRY